MALMATGQADARAALARWAAAARRETQLATACQLGAIVGWVTIAFGIGAAVAAAADGRPATDGLLLAGIGIVVRALAAWLAEDLLAKAGAAVVDAARHDILGRVAGGNAGLLLGAATGNRVSQIIDRTDRLAGYVSRWLPGIRLAVAGPVLVLAVVASQSWLSAMLLLVSVLVLPLFIWLTASETAARARTQQDSLDNLSGAFQVRAAQSGLIRAFRAVGRESARLEGASQRLRRETMSVLRVAFLSTAILEFFASVSIAFVAVYIGFKLLGVFPFETGETLDLREGLTVLLLAPEFFAPIRRLSSLHHDRSDALAAADFLSGWLGAEQERKVVKLAPLGSSPRIAFRDVEVGWPDGTAAVGGLSFEAQPGSLTVITGPSGAGKTSCLLVLLGYARLAGGSIDVGARPLADGESLARSAAYVSQVPWLMEGTIRENLAVAKPDAGRDELSAAAAKAGLPISGEDDAYLDRQLLRRGSGLSGGQRQRVALARALVSDAHIVLMDEPTAHLDAQAEAEFIGLIREIARDRTVLVASHSEALVDAADTLVRIPRTKGTSARA